MKQRCAGRWAEGALLIVSSCEIFQDHICPVLEKVNLIQSHISLVACRLFYLCPPPLENIDRIRRILILPVKLVILTSSVTSLVARNEALQDTLSEFIIDFVNHDLCRSVAAPPAIMMPYINL